MSKFQAKPYTLKTGQVIVVRSAVPQDAGQMIDLVRSVMEEGDFVVTTPEEFQVTREQEADRIRDFQAAPGKVILLAEEGGKVIGMLDFEKSSRKRLAHQGMLGMSVSKQWRDLGVGRALLKALSAWGEQEPQIEKLCLEVFASNELSICMLLSASLKRGGKQNG